MGLDPLIGHGIQNRTPGPQVQAQRGRIASSREAVDVEGGRHAGEVADAALAMVLQLAQPIIRDTQNLLDALN